MANLQNPAVLGNDWALFKSETKYGMCVPQTELGNLKVMKTGHAFCLHQEKYIICTEISRKLLNIPCTATVNIKVYDLGGYVISIHCV